MSVRNKHSSDTTSHPGATAREMLERLDLKQTEMARHLGVADSYLSDVLRGRRGVSVQLALKFEEFFEVSAEFWLRLQMNHDLAEARAERRAKRNGR